MLYEYKIHIDLYMHMYKNKYNTNTYINRCILKAGSFWQPESIARPLLPLGRAYPKKFRI